MREKMSVAILLRARQGKFRSDTMCMNKSTGNTLSKTRHQLLQKSSSSQPLKKYLCPKRPFCNFIRKLGSYIPVVAQNLATPMTSRSPDDLPPKTPCSRGKRFGEQDDLVGF